MFIVERHATGFVCGKSKSKISIKFLLYFVQIVFSSISGSSVITMMALLPRLSNIGLSPSGKAQDFDSCITLVRIQLAQLHSKNTVPVGRRIGIKLHARECLPYKIYADMAEFGRRARIRIWW